MNDKPNPPPAPKPERTFPVRMLYLDQKRTLPDGRVSDVIIGGEAQGNKPRFVIEYIPSLQHHRVAYYGPSATTPTKVMMYAREWAAWEPQQ